MQSFHYCYLDILGAEPLLLYTNRHDVIGYNLRNAAENPIIRDEYVPTSLAFHYKKMLIFFTDVDRQRIYKSNINGTLLTPIISQNLAVSGWRYYV